MMFSFVLNIIDKNAVHSLTTLTEAGINREIDEGKSHNFAKQNMEERSLT